MANTDFTDNAPRRPSGQSLMQSTPRQFTAIPGQNTASPQTTPAEQPAPPVPAEQFSSLEQTSPTSRTTLSAQATLPVASSPQSQSLEDDPLPHRPKSGLGRFSSPPPATGAWLETDPIGDRQFFRTRTLELEAGQILPEVTLAYETWGTLNEARDNAVLVLHALTGDSHIKGSAGPGHPTAGWWDKLIGSGAAIDTDRYFVIAPNVLGGCMGSTGPASLAPDGKRWGFRFPFITIRDTVNAEVRLANHLGIAKWAMVIGGSLGGMRALEWATMYPERVERLVTVATTARTSADQIAWAHTQLVAIESDPGWQGGEYYDLPVGQGPHRGLSLARQIAQTTYRSALEFDQRFGQGSQADEDPWHGGRYAMQSYLEHHGQKFVCRFDANSYICITEAFMAHDLGRGRGGVKTALSTIEADVLVITVDTDRLCTPAQSEEIANGVKYCRGIKTVKSTCGHDGFLIEFNQFGPLISTFLKSPTREYENCPGQVHW